MHWLGSQPIENKTDANIHGIHSCCPCRQLLPGSWPALPLKGFSTPGQGKLEIEATKPLANQRDLALACSPGVAFACREIEENPVSAADYTARGNLVAVATNGTAALGLGNIGGLVYKPVMEGKAVLFKEFADIDVFDIEVDELDPQKFIETVARLEPSFGGINLEDSKAPDCFVIEKELKERMNIPVFHDDRHGTAIVVAARRRALYVAVGRNGSGINQR